MVNNIKKDLFLDTDENASIVIIDYSIDSYPEVKRPQATIYLKNIDTGEESRFIFSYSMLSLDPSGRKILAINLEEGNYLFSHWDYDACKREGTDIKNLFLCKENFRFKGKNKKLDHANFSIKKGESLYLGYIILNSKDASLTLRYSLEDKNKPLVFRNRKVKNISKTIQMVDWKFEMTGYKGIFE